MSSPTLYKWNGQELTIEQLAALPECVVTEQVLRRRLNGTNMPLSRAMTLPLVKGRRPGGWQGNRFYAGDLRKRGMAQT